MRGGSKAPTETTNDPYAEWRTAITISDTELLRQLTVCFPPENRPETLLDMGEQTRQRYKAEVAALEAMDWENGTPEDLSAFYEPNTFLSIAGNKYLIPKVFAFCLKWKERADKDIVDVVLCKPFITDLDAFLRDFSTKEKASYWLFLQRAHELTGNDVFADYEDEAIALRQKLVP